MRFGNSCQFAVIGAGPYGLAVASHLRGQGAEARIFGKTMDFWDNQMPQGMWLRSPWSGSHIADPEGAFTLDRYEASLGRTLTRPLPLEDFVRYGQWFQREALPDLDPRLVSQVVRDGDDYRLTLEDGETLHAANVVVATGISSFANRPEMFADLPHELVSHASDRANRDLGRFRGRRVAVVGAGQSAIESAALLHENGAQVEVLIRQPSLRWLKSRGFVEWLMDSRLYPFKAPGKIGPIGLNWLLEHPRLFTSMPRKWQDKLAARAIRPAASSWLGSRVEKVAITCGAAVASASVRGSEVSLRLQDGGERLVDHVLLGTGYRINLSRYPFLAPELLQSVRTANGYPLLDAGFESSARGLYFAGATAAYSFGPLCRFVHGTQFTAPRLARLAAKKPASRPLAVAMS